MAIDVSKLTDSALVTIFALGPDIVKAVTYYRPASLNPRTGSIASAEVRVACSAILLQPRSVDFRGAQYIAGDEKALIRASELTAIVSPGPAPGDFIIDAGGQRRDILMVEKDTTGKIYKFKVASNLHDDWGDLTTNTLSEDWSDLTAADTFEDRGGLISVIV